MMSLTSGREKDRKDTATRCQFLPGLFGMWSTAQIESPLGSRPRDQIRNRMN